VGSSAYHDLPDPLGRQAARISKNGSLEMWANQMDDGAKAAGLFDRGEDEYWMRSLRSTPNQYEPTSTVSIVGTDICSVPRHGVVLLRVTPAR
jgi:hypothetical protein